MSIFIRHTFCENFGENMCYQTQMPPIFCDIFSDIGQCFCPATTKSLKIKNQATLESFKIIYLTISKYFRPLHKLVWAVDALQTDDNDR